MAGLGIVQVFIYLFGLEVTTSGIWPVKSNLKSKKCISPSLIQRNLGRLRWQRAVSGPSTIDWLHESGPVLPSYDIEKPLQKYLVKIHNG